MISLGGGIPSRDFTSEDVFSALMMSMQSSTHSSQTNTVGPAMSLCTSCWLLPQNEQNSVFLLSLATPLLISKLRRGSFLRADAELNSRSRANQT